MPSRHLILCHPLLLLPSILPSIRVFSNESTLCMRLPKYWSFSFSIIPSKEHPGLISFRMDWLDLLTVQGTLKSLVQHSSKASILRCSAFFCTSVKILYLLRNLKHCSLALYKSSLINKPDKPKVYNCQNLSRYFVVISATVEVGKLRGRSQRAVTARALGFSEELYGHGGDPQQPSKPAKPTARLQSQLGCTGCVPWATCSASL